MRFSNIPSVGRCERVCLSPVLGNSHTTLTFLLDIRLSSTYDCGESLQVIRLFNRSLCQAQRTAHTLCVPKETLIRTKQREKPTLSTTPPSLTDRQQRENFPSSLLSHDSLTTPKEKRVPRKRKKNAYRSGR